jgi:hypothetical protein
MNRIFILPEDDLRGLPYRRIHLLIRKNRWTRQAIGAAFGIIGGMLSIILGLLLWALAWVLPPDSLGSSLTSISNLFFLLPFPLLALGACCLDLLEKMPPDLPLPARPQPLRFQRRQRLDLQLSPKLNHQPRPSSPHT